MSKPIIANLPSIEVLETHDLPALKLLYKELFNTPLPKYASLDWLRGNIAWTIQVLQQKKDPVVIRRSLLKMALAASTTARETLSVGTCLIREWQGQTYEVRVVEKGFQWQGNFYKSLSRIAQEITGTKWSGPRFFGLKKSKQ